MATLLAWAYSVRPTASLSIAAISLFAVTTWRIREIAIYLTVGAFWLTALLTLNGWEFGYLGLGPPIYQDLAWSLNGSTARLLGILASPGRGLLIYCPVVAFLIYLAARHFRSIPSQKLALMAFVVIIMQLLILAANTYEWWGGYCYGPRYCTDLVPWFVLLAILGCSAFTKNSSTSALGTRISIGGGLTLLVLSFTLNAPGALSRSSMAWNNVADVDEHPERLWNWRNPPFMAPLRVAVTNH
jgi:hypothetical protein